RASARGQSRADTEGVVTGLRVRSGGGGPHSLVALRLRWLRARPGQGTNEVDHATKVGLADVRGAQVDGPVRHGTDRKSGEGDDDRTRCCVADEWQGGDAVHARHT